MSICHGDVTIGHDNVLMNLDTSAIKTTFEAALTDTDAFSIRFYRNLFTARPDFRALFPEDMSNQRKKLLQTLAAMVGKIDTPESMSPMLRNLGSRHVQYGALPEHYPIVSNALLQAFRETLGERFTPAADAAWTDALGWIAGEMIAGALTQQSA
jgi:hemoglobin-like flavoprotein